MAVLTVTPQNQSPPQPWSKSDNPTCKHPAIPAKHPPREAPRFRSEFYWDKLGGVLFGFSSSEKCGCMWLWPFFEVEPRKYKRGTPLFLLEGNTCESAVHTRGPQMPKQGKRSCVT